MFSFIRKFFERRKALAAERNRLCNDLLQRVSWALSDYIDASKTKDALQKWIDDKSKLLVEVSDISEFKRSSYYKQLKQQIKFFAGFYPLVLLLPFCRKAVNSSVSLMCVIPDAVSGIVRFLPKPTGRSHTICSVLLCIGRRNFLSCGCFCFSCQIPFL